jgi:hypothetical protein
MYRCIDVRANALVSVPWAVQSGDRDIYANGQAELPPAMPWLADLPGLLWRTEAALALTSTAYWHKLKASGRTMGLRWLQPDTMTPVWEGTEPYPVRYTRALPGKAQKLQLPAEDVAYMHLPGIAETVPRPAPAAAGATAAGVLYNSDTFVTEFFKRGAIKATILGVPADTPPQAKAEMKAWYDRVLSGIKNAWSAQVINADAITPTVIGSGIDELSNNTLTSEKREDIATALGVPHSLVLSNAANFATAEADRLNFYETTILPEAGIVAMQLNRQLFEPLKLHFEWRPQEMTIYQEDEEQRAQAFKTYVDAGIPLAIAAEMLGLKLPEGVEYADLEPEPQPITVLPSPSFVEPRQLPAPAGAAREGEAEEIRKLRKWAKGKPSPDVTKFKSDILSDGAKRKALGLEVGGAEYAPFRGRYP